MRHQRELQVLSVNPLLQLLWQQVAQPTPLRDLSCSVQLLPAQSLSASPVDLLLLLLLLLLVLLLVLVLLLLSWSTLALQALLLPLLLLPLLPTFVDLLIMFCQTLQ